MTTSPVWRLDCATSNSTPDLVLVDGAHRELVMAEHALAQRRRMIDPDTYAALRGDGIVLSDTEVAVYRALRHRLGFGGVAAVHVALIPPDKLKVAGYRTVSPQDIDSDVGLGVVLDGVSRPPFIVLRKGPSDYDGLLLTWSHQWEAFRCYVRHRKVELSARAFDAALQAHVDAVRALLFPSLPPNIGMRGTCLN